ncbi:hypothetical protein VNO77_07756 [Canavalia gladiata]|uniref:Uncharacterized protein n=1 Tax=Canavalia gladiata TaxID=3824 RepID=A0AAN9M8P5_CANGL
MLHLLRDMGREIIREESPEEPLKRSRLRFHEEVIDVLSKYKGTHFVKGLALKLPNENTICINTKAFKWMTRLKLLQLAGVQFDGDYKYLPQGLRFLCWQGFPLTHIPAEFKLNCLVVIELKYSNLKELWKKGQMLENLKVLDLSHSKYLITTPDFSYLPNLEKLVLEDCSSLRKVSNSIGVSE